MVQVGQQDVDKLSTIIMQNMDSDGMLGQIKAQIRSSVYKVKLQKQIMQSQDHKQKKTVGFELQNPISKKIQSIPEELIAEFLQFFQMNYTLSVFNEESNILPNTQLRQKIKQKLNLQTSTQRPILIDIIEGYFSGQKESQRPSTAPIKAEPLNKQEMKKQIQKNIEKKEERKEEIKQVEVEEYLPSKAQKSVLGPLPSFKSNIGTKGSLAPIGQKQNITETNLTSNSLKKDPYSFDFEPPKNYPAKVEKQEIQSKQNNINLFNKTQTIQKKPVQAIMILQRIFMKKRLNRNLICNSPLQEKTNQQNNQMQSQSENMAMISQSQAMDITVDSGALEEYDYFEVVKD